MQIQPHPYPHFAASDAIPEPMLNTILAHWPDAENFHEDSSGSRYHVSKLEDYRPSPLPAKIDRFWRDLAWDFCVPLAARQIDAYRPWIDRFFGEDLFSLGAVGAVGERNAPAIRYALPRRTQ